MVGGFCAALLIVGIIWLFVRLRRRYSGPSRPNDDMMNSQQSTVQYESKKAAELRGFQPGELSCDTIRKELPNNTQAQRHELPER